MTGLYLVIGFVGLFGLVIWLGFRAARQTGEIEHRAETGEAMADHGKRAAAIDEAVARADPDKLRDELRPDHKPK